MEGEEGSLPAGGAPEMVNMCTICSGSRDNSVGIATKLLSGLSWSRALIPGKGKGFSSSSQRPNLLSCPPSFLFKGY
jgi:hypothetical protein